MSPACDTERKVSASGETVAEMLPSCDGDGATRILAAVGGRDTEFLRSRTRNEGETSLLVCGFYVYG